MSNNEYSGGAGFGYGSGQSANVSFGSNPNPPSSSMAVKDISTAEFRSEVIDASATTPVLVDFWAPWCGPCKQLAPALETAVAATRGKVRLVKMNIDEHPQIAGQLGVQSIPAVFAFVDGRPVDAFMGAKNEGEIREFIAKIAADNGPSPIDMMLEKAQEAIDSGNKDIAGQIYAQILSAEPENLKARAALGKFYLSEENFEGAESILNGLDENQLADAEIAAFVTALELARQAEDLADTGDLEKAVDQTPDDHQARLDLAIALNAAGKRDEAADHLLYIIKHEADWER